MAISQVGTGGVTTFNQIREGAYAGDRLSPQDLSNFGQLVMDEMRNLKQAGREGDAAFLAERAVAQITSDVSPQAAAEYAKQFNTLLSPWNQLPVPGERTGMR